MEGSIYYGSVDFSNKINLNLTKEPVKENEKILFLNYKDPFLPFSKEFSEDGFSIKKRELVF